MPRVAFRLRIKPDAIEEYEKAHRNVWPELLAKLKQVDFGLQHFPTGPGSFSVNAGDGFRGSVGRAGAGSREPAVAGEMPKCFEPVPGLQSGERFAMLKEVFYME